MKPRILLINPGHYLPVVSGLPVNAFQPIGLGYLAWNLKKHGFQVAILDVLAEGFNQERVLGKWKYVGLSKPEVKKRIKAFKPNLVGIGVPFTAQAKAGHEMARLVKTINPVIRVVLGGSYPTTHAEQVLKDKNVDFVVLGEGEITLLELTKAFEKGKSFRLTKIKGLAFRQGNGVRFNPARLPLMDLDDYQVAWELLPMDQYFQAASYVRAARSISTYGKRWATIFTSRGCPFHCTFCVGHEVMGRQWRPRSVENVIEEMEFLIRNYQIEHFDVEDDNFTLEKNRAKEICDAIIKKKWQIQWSTPNGIRADTVDEELIKKMAQSGCVRTIVAPESGDQWVVTNLMKKNLDLKKIKQVVSWCRQYGISVDAFFIIGMPGETENQIRKSIAFAKELRKLGVDDCGFGVAIPHRGTDIYELAKERGWLRRLDQKGLVEGLMMGEPMIETPELSVLKVKELLKLAHKVNAPIPWSKLKLVIFLMVKSPLRFVKLSKSYLLTRLGLSEGLLGAE